MEKQANCYEETECECYAKDEEIPIENNKCVLNLGTFPDVDSFWKFTFEMKINSLPKEENIHWTFDFLSIAFDGYDSYDRPKYPSHLTYFSYKKLSAYGQSLNIGTTSTLLMQPNLIFQEGEWYKFTAVGKPLGPDGKLMFYDWRNPDRKPTKCRAQYLIEGPGLVGNRGEYKYQTEVPCLDMEQETIRGSHALPLKVFAAKDVIGDEVMDGVVRNIVFENEATDTVVDTTC